MYRWSLIAWCCCCFTVRAAASEPDSLFIQKLLQRIEQLQAKENGVFPRGSFPSYRIYAWNQRRSKADINPFFTGLIGLALRDMRPWLDTAGQRMADRICMLSMPAYLPFRNRSGRPTYNFWPTHPPTVFPHSGWMNLLNKIDALPDDLDDTSIILLAMGAGDSTAKQVHQLMQSFAIGAYSSWFGKNWPAEFDVCVLSNVLYMVQSYNLAWAAADSASLDLIVRVLKDRRHLYAAAYVSPNYGKLPIILYHLSRLMAVKPIPALESLKPQLVADAQRALASHHPFHEQILLSTALMRWGVAPPEINIPLNGTLHDLIEEGSFSFFIANMASVFPDPFKRWVGASGMTRFYNDCPAYNNLLLLENLVWKKRMHLHLH
jgi:hypothetical protein